jgi:SAM-dependent methyltransferase
MLHPDLRHPGPTNADPATVRGFGEEWSRFDQSALDEGEAQRIFEEYFSYFPWHELPDAAEGFDAGCGSGRWAKFVARRVGRLHLVDASENALQVARRNLAGYPHCEFHVASVDAIPVPEASQDFGYSLGVLHHVPDTAAALRACVARLKDGAPFLVYLYYALDDRPLWFRALWRATDVVRRGVSRLPFRVRAAFAEVVAVSVYWPLARTARTVERAGLSPQGIPLAHYRDASFYTMRTDALDRFGTRLEKRFTEADVRALMESAGLERVLVYGPRYWCAVGYKRRQSAS